jgi:hypothetical protein
MNPEMIRGDVQASVWSAFNTKYPQNCLPVILELWP